MKIGLHFLNTGHEKLWSLDSVSVLGWCESVSAVIALWTPADLFLCLLFLQAMSWPNPECQQHTSEWERLLAADFMSIMTSCFWRVRFLIGTRIKHSFTSPSLSTGSPTTTSSLWTRLGPRSQEAPPSLPPHQQVISRLHFNLILQTYTLVDY